jgi:hypothetical protein
VALCSLPNEGSSDVQLIPGLPNRLLPPSQTQFGNSARSQSGLPFHPFRPLPSHPPPALTVGFRIHRAPADPESILRDRCSPREPPRERERERERENDSPETRRIFREAVIRGSSRAHQREKSDETLGAASDPDPAPLPSPSLALLCSSAIQPLGA